MGIDDIFGVALAPTTSPPNCATVTSPADTATDIFGSYKNFNAIPQGEASHRSQRGKERKELILFEKTLLFSAF